MRASRTASILSALGSDSSWQSVDAETKWYLRLTGCQRQVLSFWTLAQIVTTGAAPYFDLPSNGWDTYNRSARGYTADGSAEAAGSMAKWSIEEI